jgi:phospho-N-acetylmuramoyl-pentapeptide-transferase
MGGLLILLVTIITVLLWAACGDLHVFFVLLGMCFFGGIGLWDDWCKISYQRGISIKMKWGLQIVASLFLAICMLYTGVVDSTISLPFFKSGCIPLGLWYVLWVSLVIVSTSNAVNLTDGLDGLAICSFIPNVATFSIICYLAGHFQLARYLYIPFAASAELVVVGCALIGSSLGFLWYNAYPAQIFMGDIGSLALGAALALIALISKQELLLVISAGIFVLETLSVILQVAWVRFFKKRLFKLAPVHHHFELIGMKESKITVRFTIISIMLCLLALITLKIR